MTNPMVPPIADDWTGCVHVPVCVMDVWQCKTCGRVMVEVGGELTIEPPREVPR